MMRVNGYRGPGAWVVARNLQGEPLGEGPDEEKRRRKAERTKREDVREWRPLTKRSGKREAGM